MAIRKRFKGCSTHTCSWTIKPAEGLRFPLPRQTCSFFYRLPAVTWYFHSPCSRLYEYCGDRDIFSTSRASPAASCQLLCSWTDLPTPITPFTAPLLCGVLWFSMNPLHRAKAQSCLACQLPIFLPLWTMDMQFRNSPPFSQNQHLFLSISPRSHLSHPVRVADQRSAGDTRLKENYPTVSIGPGGCKEKCFSIRARSLPSKQKTEEGTRTCRMRKAWRCSCRPLGRSYLRHSLLFLPPYSESTRFSRYRTASSPTSSMEENAAGGAGVGHLQGRKEVHGATLPHCSSLRR